MKKNTKTLVCFGEMLWDILPTGKLPGGAPMNVAIHWQRTGNQAQLISRIGTDELGEELLNFLFSMGLTGELVQKDTQYATGTVLADTSNPSHVLYEITQPVAWDFISLTEAARQAVQDTDFFVFGSLAARSIESEATLKKLLEVAPCPVFDCNLRAPFYSKENIEVLLQATQILKINDQEIGQLANWFGCQGSQEEIVRQLAGQFSLTHVCVTLGADGSAVLADNQWVTCPGFSVNVVDTIGSGDAFLATFLEGIASKKSLTDILTRANAIGALVASKPGAVPPVSNQEIQSILNTPLVPS